MDDVAKIAAGLSKAEARALVQKAGTHDAIVTEDMAPLWYVIRKHEPNHFTIGLTSLGLAVRAHILENDK